MVLLKDNLNEFFSIAEENKVIIDLGEISIGKSSMEPMNSAWPMQSHDNHHTGRSPYSTADNQGIEKWRFYCGWGENSPVIDADGIIYFGNGDRYLYAFYPDGTLKWKYKSGGIIGSSSPAIAEDGTIYFGVWDQFFYAINPDGTQKWKFNPKANIDSSPAIAEDGTIYFGTMWSLGDGGKIHALNPDGSEKWRYQTGWHITSSPAIGDDGTIYIGSGDSYIYAMWPNGTLRWRYKTGDEIHGHPSIAEDGTIYISSYDGYLYALYPDGGLKWKLGGCVDEACPAIDKDGVLYLGNDKLRAIYPNGTIKWSITVPGGYIGFSSPAICDDGIIYFGVGTKVVAVDSNGTVLWHKTVAEKSIRSSPCIAEDGTVYIGSSFDIGGGYLHVFGSVESNVPPENPIVLSDPTGKKGERYYLRVSSFDPDNNPISYYIEWGDGNTLGWTLDRASEEVCYFDHIWANEGSYTIRAKVKDVMGEESDWIEFEIKISNPRIRHLFRFLDMFPLLQKILNYIF